MASCWDLRAAGRGTRGHIITMRMRGRWPFVAHEPAISMEIIRRTCTHTQLFCNELACNWRLQRARKNEEEMPCHPERERNEKETKAGKRL